MRRNTPGQVVTLQATGPDGRPVTGAASGLTFFVEKDDDGQVIQLPFVVTEADPVRQKGSYDCGPLDAPYTDAYKLQFSGTSTDPDVTVWTQVIYTTAGYLSVPGEAGGTLFVTSDELTRDWGRKLLVDLSNIDNRNAVDVDGVRLQEAILSAGGDIEAAYAGIGYQLPLNPSDQNDVRYLKELSSYGVIAWLYEHKPGVYKDPEGRPTNPGSYARKYFSDQLNLIRIKARPLSAGRSSPKIGTARGYSARGLIVGRYNPVTGQRVITTNTNL